MEIGKTNKWVWRWRPTDNDLVMVWCADVTGCLTDAAEVTAPVWRLWSQVTIPEIPLKQNNIPDIGCYAVDGRWRYSCGEHLHVSRYRPITALRAAPQPPSCQHPSFVLTLVLKWFFCLAALFVSSQLLICPHASRFDRICKNRFYIYAVKWKAAHSLSALLSSLWCAVFTIGGGAWLTADGHQGAIKNLFNKDSDT